MPPIIPITILGHILALRAKKFNPQFTKYFFRLYYSYKHTQGEKAYAGIRNSLFIWSEFLQIT